MSNQLKSRLRKSKQNRMSKNRTINDISKKNLPNPQLMDIFMKWKNPITKKKIELQFNFLKMNKEMRYFLVSRLLDFEIIYDKHKQDCTINEIINSSIEFFYKHYFYMNEDEKHRFSLNQITDLLYHNRVLNVNNIHINSLEVEMIMIVDK